MVYVYIWKLLLPCNSQPRFWHILFHSLGPFRAWKKRLSPSRRKADETCCVNVCLGVFSSISSQALRGLLQFLTSKESHLPKLLPTAVKSLHFFLLFLQETEKLAWLLFNFAKSPFAAQNYIEKILSRKLDFLSSYDASSSNYKKTKKVCCYIIFYFKFFLKFASLLPINQWQQKREPKVVKLFL